jgi:hypothetical protein
MSKILNHITLSVTALFYIHEWWILNPATVEGNEWVEMRVAAWHENKAGYVTCVTYIQLNRECINNGEYT